MTKKLMCSVLLAVFLVLVTDSIKLAPPPYRIYENGEFRTLTQSEMTREMSTGELIIIWDPELDPPDGFQKDMEELLSSTKQLLAANLEDIVELIPYSAVNIVLACGKRYLHYIHLSYDLREFKEVYRNCLDSPSFILAYWIDGDKIFDA